MFAFTAACFATCRPVLAGLACSSSDVHTEHLRSKSIPDAARCAAALGFDVSMKTVVKKLQDPVPPSCNAQYAAMLRGHGLLVQRLMLDSCFQTLWQSGLSCFAERFCMSLAS